MMILFLSASGDRKDLGGRSFGEGINIMSPSISFNTCTQSNQEPMSLIGFTKLQEQHKSLLYHYKKPVIFSGRAFLNFYGRPAAYVNNNIKKNHP